MQSIEDQRVFVVSRLLRSRVALEAAVNVGEPWSLFDLCKPSASMCAPPPGEKTGGKVNIGRYGSVTWIEMQPNQLLCIVCRVEGRSIENALCGWTSWVDD